MTSAASFKFLRLMTVIFLATAGFSWVAIADDTNAVTNGEARMVESAIINNQEALRASLAVQEQLKKTQLALEANRLEAEAAADRNAKLIEELINSRHTEEMKQLAQSNAEMQHSNQVVLVASGAFAVFGFLVLLFAALLQWNTVNRINAVASRMPPGLAIAAGLPALTAGEGPGPAAEHSAQHFLTLVDRLEKRLSDMDDATSRKALTEGTSNGESNGNGNGHGEAAAPQSHDSMKAVTVMLGKGQTLLKLDQPEAALACFDEVLALDSGNTEAMLKKGTALERLQRLDEAIECYDHAIATDHSITMAYLYKGGVFNRLERYNEALECYEQALKTQDKGRVAAHAAE